jgi:hypothetical protein
MAMVYQLPRFFLAGGVDSSGRRGTPSVPTTSSFPTSSQWTLPPSTGPRRTQAGGPRPGPAERERQDRRDRLFEDDPPFNPNSATWPEDPALTPSDYQLLKNFHKRLAKDVLETCDRCLER